MTGPIPRCDGGLRDVVAGVAAVAGLVHAGFSIDWSLGGTVLLRTVGDDVVQLVGGRPLVLIAVCGVKLALAMLALVLLERHVHPAVPWAALAAGVPMALWGLANVVVGGAVLLGVLRPDAAPNTTALRGHVLLWDPLFILWGAGLAILALAQLRTDRRRPGRELDRRRGGRLARPEERASEQVQEGECGSSR